MCSFLSVFKCDYGVALFLSLSILVTEWSLFEVGAQFVFAQQANVMAKPREPGCLQLTAGHTPLFLTIQSPFPVLVHGSSRPSLIITGLQHMGCVRCNSDYTRLNSQDLYSNVNNVEPFKIATSGGQKHSSFAQFTQLS